VIFGNLFYRAVQLTFVPVIITLSSQMTDTSSLRLQSWSPNSRCSHSASDASWPLQLTSSNRIRRVPTPKRSS